MEANENQENNENNGAGQVMLVVYLQQQTQGYSTPQIPRR
jgi:hypothetical protein